MAVAAIFTSCDEHRDFLDTGMKVGHILCTDGNVMSFQQYEVSDKEAIAVVFHTNTDTEIEGEGYAVYLHDLYPEMFADSIIHSTCSVQAEWVHLWQRVSLTCGGTGRVPISLRWHRCVCFMVPSSM